MSNFRTGRAFFWGTAAHWELGSPEDAIVGSQDIQVRRSVSDDKSALIAFVEKMQSNISKLTKKYLPDTCMLWQ
jgi:hypothetical protein